METTSTEHRSGTRKHAIRSTHRRGAYKLDDDTDPTRRADDGVAAAVDVAERASPAGAAEEDEEAVVVVRDRVVRSADAGAGAWGGVDARTGAGAATALARSDEAEGRTVEADVLEAPRNADATAGVATSARVRTCGVATPSAPHVEPADGSTERDAPKDEEEEEEEEEEEDGPTTEEAAADEEDEDEDEEGERKGEDTLSTPVAEPPPMNP